MSQRIPDAAPSHRLPIDGGALRDEHRPLRAFRAGAHENSFPTSAEEPFFPGGVSALEALGFEKHVAYPSAVHQYLSPNDNRLHGAAKARWRNSGVDFKDDVESSLKLLSHLDEDLKAHGATWFERNMLGLTAGSATELIRGRRGQRSQVDYDRLSAYKNFVGLDVKAGSEEGDA